MINSTFEDQLERNGKLIYTNKGDSMMPLIKQDRDLLVIVPAEGRLKKYDVAFYIRRRTGQLVLHRMIGFTKDGGYIFCGDNQYDYEYGVGDDDILALMTSFIHNGKERKVTDFSYRFYVHRLMLKKRLRRFAGRVYHKLFDRSK